MCGLLGLIASEAYLYRINRHDMVLGGSVCLCVLNVSGALVIHCAKAKGWQPKVDEATTLNEKEIKLHEIGNNVELF